MPAAVVREMSVVNALKCSPSSVTETRLAWTAVAALALGVAIYALDRDWGSTQFLGTLAGSQPGQHAVFGPLGATLPSFLHAYAFTVLLVVMLWPWPRAATGAALAWFAVSATLEILQAPAVALSAFGPRDAPSGAPLFQSLALYATRGEFDLADLSATAVGCATAWFITMTSQRRPS